MEPDILASAGAPDALAGEWADATTIQSEDPPKVETPTDLSTGRTARMHAVTAQVPVVPRSRPHTGGYTNGHARPRSLHGAWPVTAPQPAVITPTVLPFETPRPEGWYLRAGKRAIDVLGASIALVLFAPIIAVLAVIVRATSRGPVFYRSTRIGRGGHAFTFYKLRSMVKDADLKRQHVEHLNEADGPVFKIARDPRITPIGRFMR